MSTEILEPPTATVPVTPIKPSPLENITALVWKNCSKERQKMLGPILSKLLENEDTPASSAVSKHGAFKGGLLAHIDNAMHLALSFKLSILQMAARQLIPSVLEETECLTNESVVTAILLHDIQKISDLNGNIHYVPNILTDGKRSEKKPWKVNDAYSPTAIPPDSAVTNGSTAVILNHVSLQYPSGLVSLALAEKWSPGIVATLTESEKQAIVWHGGAYEKGDRKGFAGSETLLWLVTHAADFASAIVGL